MTTHGKDHAATRSDAKPSIDAESLIRAGLPLIPLHRWDARDAKGRARGKSPIDGAWQSRDYDSREVLAQAERRGLNVGVRLPPSWMVLDVDPRNFPEGRDSLAELVADARLDLDTCPHGHKGRDAVSGKNLIHIVMASNSDWVVPAGLGDERRFAVFEVNGSRRGDKAFFDALNAQLYGDDRAGLAAFLHEMLTRNIEGWAPRDSVPQTRALEEQKLRGLDIQQEWWLSLLQSGDRPYDGTDHKGDWTEREVRVLCESVHSSYRDYARAKGRQWLAPDQLGRVLKTYGVRRCQLGSGELRGKMAYVLPSLGQAFATFSELTGIPLMTSHPNHRSVR